MASDITDLNGRNVASGSARGGHNSYLFRRWMLAVQGTGPAAVQAIFIAGAGAAYLNGALGVWELGFCAVITGLAYLGLRRIA